MVYVSRAPLAKLQAYGRCMGWCFPWVSVSDNDFNFDMSFSRTEEQTREAIAPMLEHRVPPAVDQMARETGTDAVGYLSEAPGFSVFVLDDDAVYQTYATTARGLEFLMGLLPDPRPRPERAGRGRRRADLDPAARRVRTDAMMTPTRR
jgi:predicted dithiol-disulfide oxidoreductase (DUF899 family)